MNWKWSCHINLSKKNVTQRTETDIIVHTDTLLYYVLHIRPMESVRMFTIVPLLFKPIFLHGPCSLNHTIVLCHKCSVIDVLGYR